MNQADRRGSEKVTPTGFKSEDILPDDYPIYGNYLYVADGKVYRSDWHGVTVRELKAREGFKEVRRCNIVARQEDLERRRSGDRTNDSANSTEA